MRRRTGLAVLIGGGIAAIALGSLALADVIDPSMPRAITIGAPRGFAPSERVDARRRGRASTPLPFPPAESWQRRVNGGIEVSPVVGPKGELYVSLSTPEVVALDDGGRELWRARVGASAALVPPVLTSAGGVVVVTAAGIAYGLSQSGVIRFETPIERDVECSPVALDDGSVVVAAGRALVVLDGDGAVQARATLDDRAVGGLLAGPDGIIATTESGTVFSWRPPAAPRRLGAFSGTPKRGGAFADGRTLLAVVDGRMLVGFDLPTGTSHVRAHSASVGSPLDGPVAVGPGGVAVTSTYGGLLLGVDASGGERLHAVIDKQPQTSGADAGMAMGFFAATDLKPSPPVIVDDEGRVGFARAGGRVGVVAPDGSVGVVSDQLCASPVAVQPAGDRRMLVACRDGTLWMLTQGGRP